MVRALCIMTPAILVTYFTKLVYNRINLWAMGFTNKVINFTVCEKVNESKVNDFLFSLAESEYCYVAFSFHVRSIIHHITLVKIPVLLFRRG